MTGTPLIATSDDGMSRDLAFPSQRRCLATPKTFNHGAGKCDALEGAKNLSGMLIPASIRGIPPLAERRLKPQRFLFASWFMAIRKVAGDELPR